MYTGKLLNKYSSPIMLKTWRVIHGKDIQLPTSTKTSKDGNPLVRHLELVPQTKTSGKNPVTNFNGKGWAGSLVTGGDKLTGELHSPKFKITKRFLNFLIAGGSRSKVGIELWINDKKKLVSRGSNNENFAPRSWDLNSYLGYDAQIRLVDYETGGGGTFMQTDFSFLPCLPLKISEVPVPPLREIERIADLNDLSPKLLTVMV